MPETVPRDPAQRPPAGAGRAARLLLAAGLALAAGYAAVALYLRGGEPGFPLDDSWIHLQFARNLAAGSGLSYNAGELVPGSTAPLWTALLSLVFLLPGSPVTWTWLLGVAAYLATIHATRELARELGLGGALVDLAAALALATSWLVWSALSGLEIPLFALLSLWGMVLHLRERRHGGAPRSMALLGLAALARPEGLLLVALALADRSLAFSRDAAGALAVRFAGGGALLRGALLAALLVLPMVLFNYAVSGSPLPTTFAAKASGARHWLPSTGYLYSVLSIFFRPQPILVLTAGAGALALVERLGTGRDRGLLPALWLFGLPLAFAAIAPQGGGVLAGNFGRYYFPLFPVLAVVGVLGFERAFRALGPWLRAGALALPVRAVLLALLFVPTATSLVEGAGRYAQSVTNVEESDVRMARWLAPRLPEGAVLAVNDIGALKFFLPEHRILDLAGIAHPEVGRRMDEARRRGLDPRRGILEFLEQTRPDFLVIFPSWFPGLATAGSPFERLHTLEIADNITMGGNEIAVLSTPWTRAPLRQVEPEGPGPAAGEENDAGTG